MSFELLLGLRYTRARRRNHFISFISLISMLGIALGVMALIVVLSVMNGFQKELRTRILGVASHVQISSLDGDLRQWQDAAALATRQAGVAAVAPYVSAQSMLSYDQSVRGAVVRGVLPDMEEKVADFNQHMKHGVKLQALKAGEFGIILGSELARALRLFPGDKVTVIAPQGLVTPAAILPRLKQFRVIGLFDVGMYEYDASLALVHLHDAQALYRMGDGVSGVRLKLDDLFAAPRVAGALSASLPADFVVSDWTRNHANFFRAVNIEKNMMFIILSLIVAVAAFNIVSTLIMAVTDKEADIAILRTLGASPRSVMTIFIIQGAVIGAIGLGLGVAAGLGLALNLETVVPALEQLLGVSLWTKEVYFINELPSDVQAADVIAVTLISFALTLVATLYPSWHASRVNPAEALRYE